VRSPGRHRTEAAVFASPGDLGSLPVSSLVTKVLGEPG
jgi:hypothetical protein